MHYQEYASDEQMQKDSMLISAIKNKAQELECLYAEALTSFTLQNYGPREMALAKTNLEQSVMWAIKGIRG